MLSDLTTGFLTIRDASGVLRPQTAVNPKDELEDAIRLFKQAAAAAPGEPEPKLRLGRTLYRHGDLEGAARELDAALRIPSPDVLTFLLFLFRGQVDAAAGHLRSPRSAALVGCALAIAVCGAEAQRFRSGPAH